MHIKIEYNQPKSHLQIFLMTKNLVYRLKTIKKPTSYEYNRNVCAKRLDHFKINPPQHSI